MRLDNKTKSALKKDFGRFINFDVPMSGHTSFKVGGPADVFAEPLILEDLTSLITWSHANRIPYDIIGGGTNLLVTDPGIRGIVISLKKMNADIIISEKNEEHTLLIAGAGIRTHSVCQYAIRHGLQGFNFALGIPGTIGGSIIMNAGTSYGSMENVVHAIKIMEASGNIRNVTADKLNFSYRGFSLNGSRKGFPPETIILECTFKLGKGDTASLKKEADGIISERNIHQPTSLPSAGCFFKNPSSEKTAGELIDLAGLKGEKIGGAQISPKHANFIVNAGQATADDVLKLKNLIIKAVSDKFNIILKTEVRIVGEE